MSKSFLPSTDPTICWMNHPPQCCRSLPDSFKTNSTIPLPEAYLLYFPCWLPDSKFWNAQKPVWALLTQENIKAVPGRRMLVNNTGRAEYHRLFFWLPQYLSQQAAPLHFGEISTARPGTCLRPPFFQTSHLKTHHFPAVSSGVPDFSHAFYPSVYAQASKRHRIYKTSYTIWRVWSKLTGYWCRMCPTCLPMMPQMSWPMQLRLLSKHKDPRMQQFWCLYNLEKRTPTTSRWGPHISCPKQSSWNFQESYTWQDIDVFGCIALIRLSIELIVPLQWLQTALWERHKIRTIRRTLTEVAATGRLDEKRNLWIGDILVSLSYYRAGYSPDDYASSKEWQARYSQPATHKFQSCPLLWLQLQWFSLRNLASFW